jgi:hypothetical protein
VVSYREAREARSLGYCVGQAPTEHHSTTLTPPTQAWARAVCCCGFRRSLSRLASSQPSGEPAVMSAGAARQARAASAPLSLLLPTAKGALSIRDCIGGVAPHEQKQPHLTRPPQSLLTTGLTSRSRRSSSTTNGSSCRSGTRRGRSGSAPSPAVRVGRQLHGGIFLGACQMISSCRCHEPCLYPSQPACVCAPEHIHMHTHPPTCPHRSVLPRRHGHPPGL